MTDNDKQFDAMMSTLFECADMNTEDLEEFADSYLDKLRADAERWRKVKEGCDYERMAKHRGTDLQYWIGKRTLNVYWDAIKEDSSHA